MDEPRESGLHGSIWPARELDSERWNRTFSDLLQPMIDWVAESAAREDGAKDRNK